MSKRWSILPEPERPLTRGQHVWRWKVLLSTYFAYAGYYLTRKVFGIVKPVIADAGDGSAAIADGTMLHTLPDPGPMGGAMLDTVNAGALETTAQTAGLGLTYLDVAHIWTAYLVAYMLGQFINSFIGRKWGPRLILLGGLGLSILCNIVFGFANSFATFFVFMFFNGLVQASGWPGTVGGIAEWLRPKERGSIMGVWSTSYLVGNITVKGVGGYLLDLAGWRYAFFGCTLIAFGIWWIIYFWQRNKPEDVGLDPIVRQEDEVDLRSIRASQEEHIPMGDYLRLALNPLVLAMGLSYFCIKFLRYALDSWLPTFLYIQGMGEAQAAYYSSIFDFAGLPGAIIAGWALDRVFRGDWAALCFTMGIGMVVGYLLVVYFGANPYALAFSFGLVGFMMYGPDTILCGAASISVAGEKNGVALAGIVNGFGSIGPVVQEEVIGLLVTGDQHAGMRNTNLMALGMSILFVLLMLLVMWRVAVAHRNNAEPL